jgi:hypothetical protein
MGVRMGTLAWVALAVIAGSLLIAGCGDDDGGEEQVAEALGGGEEDADSLGTFFEDLDPFPDLQIQLVAAFRSEDVAGAREIVDEQLRLLDRGDEIVAEFESDELRDVVGDYLSGLRDSVEASDRFVAYFQSPGPGDPTAERALLADLERAGTKAEAAERQFVERLRDNLPDEADEQIEEGLQDFSERFREAQRSGEAP